MFLPLEATIKNVALDISGNILRIRYDFTENFIEEEPPSRMSLLNTTSVFWFKVSIKTSTPVN